MHAAFIPYGKKDLVDYFIGELQHQKLPMRFYKEGEEDKSIHIQCQIRQMPGGIYEFIFPKEFMASVLTTLKFNNKTESDYQIDRDISILGMKINPLTYVRKFLRYEATPEFKTDQFLPIMSTHVSIIPIGIRHDGILTEPEGAVHAGWKHESI